MLNAHQLADDQQHRQHGRGGALHQAVRAEDGRHLAHGGELPDPHRCADRTQHEPYTMATTLRPCCGREL
ncbi:hypothetical protein [Streptomyces tailanensis]|uniref:hypothetical protein n=1 Tax=Streptomyces tailanensis TaxID=2569858 RepID=UPI00122E1B81|nr:hypothetical protein [Streptomyces tailanensis]